MMAEFGKRSKVTLIQALSFIFCLFRKTCYSTDKDAIQLSKLASAKKKEEKNGSHHFATTSFAKRNFKPFPSELGSEFLYENICDNDTAERQTRLKMLIIIENSKSTTPPNDQNKTGSISPESHL